MEKVKLEVLRDTAAHTALAARSRIEAAVDAGELPIWVLETCESWERSSMVYGSASAHLKTAPLILLAGESTRLH